MLITAGGLLFRRRSILRGEKTEIKEQNLPLAYSLSHIHPKASLDAYLPLNQNSHSLTEVCPVPYLLNADYSRRVEAREPSGTQGIT